MNTVPDKFKKYVPTHCPHCKSPLVVEDVHLLCKNPDCSGVKKAMFHQAMGMLELFGIGGSMVEDIYNSGFTNPIEILNPTIFNKKNLVAKGIVPDGKLVENLFSEIAKIKELSLQKIILMLGYQGMGSTTSGQIAKYVAGVDYSFAGLQKSIVEGFEPGQPKRIKLDNAIGELMQFIDIKMPEDLSNKIGLEMTGSPKGAGFDSKETFLDVAKKYGFIHSKISDAKILVTDDLNSKTGKMANAAKMNAKKPNSIEVLSYEQFVDKYCKGYSVPTKPNIVNAAAKHTSAAPAAKNLF